MSGTRHTVTSIAKGARQLGVSEETLRNYVRRGYVTAYRVPGRRGHFVDVTEARESLARQPRSKVRMDYGDWGPDAKVVDLEQSATGASK